MTLRDLFSRRGAADDDHLPQLTDDELLRWGSTLAREPVTRPRRAPLRAAEKPPSRRRPLVADPL